MNVFETELPGVLRIEPRIFRDERGRFVETFHGARYAAAGINGPFVQDSVSRSLKGTLRGLHFQYPRGQAKLIQALSGVIYDVVVDVRRGSPTFRRWMALELTAEGGQQIFIPSGFAHGFVALSESADLSYKCTDFYAPETEHTILWSDPGLAITWPVRDPRLSAKDASAPRLVDAPVLPTYESRGSVPEGRE
jgi:dTDP-4-dehydrorhamnose 3,5-epimerase